MPARGEIKAYITAITFGNLAGNSADAWLARGLAARAGEVTGTLPSPAMLAQARGNLNELGIGNVALVEAPLSSRHRKFDPARLLQAALRRRLSYTPQLPRSRVVGQPAAAGPPGQRGTDRGQVPLPGGRGQGADLGAGGASADRAGARGSGPVTAG